jgi:hypothetical protein
MDEDGQHDPSEIGKLIDRAIDSGAQLVYAHGANRHRTVWHEMPLAR